MSPNLRAFACLLGLLAPATGAADQKQALNALPAPGVLSVQTLGYWATAEGRSGDVRLVTRDAGLETPRISQTVVWSLRDFDTRQFDNSAAVALTDCASEPLGQMRVLSAVQPDLDGPVFLVVLPLGAEKTETSPPLTYEIGAEGEIRRIGGCS